MNRRELYFEVVRTSGDIITLVFNTPEETKMAFCAIVNLVGTSPGISLRAKPRYVIVLDRIKGGFLLWSRCMAAYVIEISNASRYKMVLDGERLRALHFYPIAVHAGDTQ